MEPIMKALSGFVDLARSSEPLHEKQGTLASVAAVTRQDLEAYRHATFARDNLSVAVVGDIDAAALGVQLDRLFGGLPPHAQIKPVPVAAAGAPQLKTLADTVRQTNVAFGYIIDTPLTARDMPGVSILNHILSGGILSSRLDREIRVKRLRGHANAHQPICVWQLRRRAGLGRAGL
jgi:zinc protease